MEAEERPLKIRKLDAETFEGESLLQPGIGRERLPSPTLSSNSQEHVREPIHAQANGVEANEEQEEAQDSNSPSSQDAVAHAMADGDEEPGQGETLLSKNQLKKLRNKERWEARREERKLKRKVKTQEKRLRNRTVKAEAHAAAKARAAANGNGQSKPVPIGPVRLVNPVGRCGNLLKQTASSSTYAVANHIRPGLWLRWSYDREGTHLPGCSAYPVLLGQLQITVPSTHYSQLLGWPTQTQIRYSSRKASRELEGREVHCGRFRQRSGQSPGIHERERRRGNGGRLCRGQGG